jgi:hypothetical protein
MKLNDLFTPLKKSLTNTNKYSRMVLVGERDNAKNIYII